MEENTLYCRYCGAELTDGIPVCPDCGRDNSVPMLGGKRRMGRTGTQGVSEYSGGMTGVPVRDSGTADAGQRAEKQVRAPERPKAVAAEYYEEETAVVNLEEPRDRRDAGREETPSSARDTENTKSEKSAKKSTKSRRRTGESESGAPVEKKKRKGKTESAGPAERKKARKAPAGPRDEEERGEKKKGGILPVLVLAAIPVIVLLFLIPRIVKRLPDPSLDGKLPFLNAQKEENPASGNTGPVSGDPGRETQGGKESEAAPPPAALTWENPAVEKAVREAAEIPSGVITEQDLAEVTYLDLSNTGMKDFSVLSRFPALVSVDLTGNGITDLKPLTGFQQLEGLCLDDNQITDLMPLREMTNLQRLYLENNGLQNLTPLKTLTGLTQLYLEDNQITDLSPLAELRNLGILHLGGNRIQDLKPISGLTNLEVLTLYSAGISDLSPLAGLVRMRQLNLWDNEIGDISVLAGMKDLNLLMLGGNRVKELQPLAGLTSMESLYLSDNLIQSIEPLKGMTGLRALELQNNEIKNINPLSSLTALEYLDLRGNPIDSYEPAHSMKIETLYTDEESGADAPPAAEAEEGGEPVEQNAGSAEADEAAPPQTPGPADEAGQ